MDAPLRHAQSIIQRVHAGVRCSLTDIELIKSLNGIHPIDVQRALIAGGATELLKSALPKLLTTLPILHEVPRDDNPVLNFWPFTNDTVEKLVRLCHSHNRIALLGIPTLFKALNGSQNSETILFDGDDYLFREDTTPGFIKCDLLGNLSTEFNNHFDLVVGDPPWYADEYRVWLEKALQLLRPGDKLVFVLFPEGVRDSAPRELDEILSLAGESLVNLSIGNEYVSYETSSFEQV